VKVKSKSGNAFFVGWKLGVFGIHSRIPSVAEAASVSAGFCRRSSKKWREMRKLVRQIVSTQTLWGVGHF